ncbi:hypothetical protein KEM60_00221 [Austwickia sp. TVS 96-490-7B]|nr:hypothetical protein [Austwickia sp. TVS 96-490-7B]
MRVFFDVDDPWTRPGPTRAECRFDVWVAVLFYLLAALSLEVARSMSMLTTVSVPIWAQHAVTASAVIPLVWRRRFPVTVMVILQLHLLVVSVWLPMIAQQWIMLVVYFLALVTGMAWAQDRWALLWAVLASLTMMFGGTVWSFALGQAWEQITSNFSAVRQPQGLFSFATATTLLVLMVNGAFFGGALIWGRSNWRGARRLAVMQAQAVTIEKQAEDLRRRAVVEERLRIARELHDVVAHHVSVMGVQAAGARRVLTRDVDAAATALSAVESSSRQAVQELRNLLGTLRDVSSGTARADMSDLVDRAPEPGLRDLPALVAQSVRPGFTPTYTLVEDTPGALDTVGAPLSLSAYRIVQEALSNVAKHSTAKRATVVVRVRRHGSSGISPYVEVEVVDDGSPCGATTGTGLGLVGMRERVTSHSGQLDVGPRLSGGFRVRARFPLEPQLVPTALTADPARMA